MQKTTASIVSNFGFGLTKRIEKYGVTKFKANLERVSETEFFDGDLVSLADAVARYSFC